MPKTAPWPLAERVRVRMRDGVELAVHVHRPAGAARVPAIVSYTPYRLGPLRPGAHLIVAAGYATVDFDIRGCGNSGGWNDSIYSDAERADGYAMIEWAAAQPWCNGNVGIWGISFGGVVALQMARAAPPHLKAVIARSGSEDPFVWWTNPGGSPRPYMYSCYAPIMTAANFSPPDPAEVGDQWAALWAERLAHNVPWGLPFIEHLTHDQFWDDRSLRGHYDAVRCPIFVVGGWHDWYHTPLLRTFATLTGPKRGLIGPWSHQWPDGGIPGPRVDWLAEARRWFDHWLKGEDTGVTRDPPLTLFVREFAPPAAIRAVEPGVYRGETAWPPARVRPTTLFLGSAGRLRASPERATGSEPLRHDPRVGVSTGLHGGGPFNVNWAMPLDQREDEAGSLVFTGEPLASDLEVTGEPQVVVTVTPGAPSLQLCAKLCDVAPDGTTALITKGWCNAAWREGWTAPVAVPPGAPLELTVPLLACAYRLAAGHRLRLMLATADLPNVWPTPHAAVHHVRRGGARPSRLMLPVCPPPPKGAPAPSVKVLPEPPCLETMTPPDYRHTRDLVNDTATLAHTVNYGPNWQHRGEYTVSARDPARTVARASADLATELPGQRIVVKAQCITTSDAAALHHVVTVAITSNDLPHWSRSWSRSVSRRGI